METTGFCIFYQHALSMYINNKPPEILGKTLIWHSQMSELFGEMQVNDLIVKATFHLTTNN